MANPDRLKLRQAALLVRLQTLREEQVSRDLAVARAHTVQARQQMAEATATYEHESTTQTDARHQRWLGRVGQELSGRTVKALHVEDEAGLASIQQHSLSQKKARQRVRQTEAASKKAEVAMVLVRNSATRRKRLMLKIQQDYKRAERLQEEVARDQHSQLLFAQRLAEKQA